MLPLPTRFAQPIARTCLHSHRPTSRTLVSRHQVCLPLDSVRAFTCIRSYPRPTVRHRPIPSRSQSQFRNCSYRRMCRSRHEDPAGGSVDFAKGREVLPKNVIPRHYDVTLEPNWKDFSFEGSVVIEYVQPHGLSCVHSIKTNNKHIFHTTFSYPVLLLQYADRS